MRRATVLLLWLHSAYGGAATVDSTNVFGPSTVRAAFLARGVGARSVGMGEAFTAVADDASAAVWNPGGLGQLTAVNALATYEAIGEGMGMGHASLALPAGPGSLAFTETALTYGSYDVRDGFGQKIGTETPMDLALGVAYGIANPGWLGGRGWSGLGVEYVREAAGDSSIAISAGSVIPVADRWTAGWALQHFAPKKDGFSLPAALKLGGAWQAVDPLKIALDVALPLADKEPWVAAGVEYAPFKVAQLRVGYKLDNKSQGVTGTTGVTAGIGFRLGAFGLDYAYQPFGDFTTSHRVSLVYAPVREPAAPAAAPVSPAAASPVPAPQPAPIVQPAPAASSTAL